MLLIFCILASFQTNTVKNNQATMVINSTKWLERIGAMTYTFFNQKFDSGMKGSAQLLFQLGACY